MASLLLDLRSYVHNGSDLYCYIHQYPDALPPSRALKRCRPQSYTTHDLVPSDLRDLYLSSRYWEDSCFDWNQHITRVFLHSGHHDSL